MLQLKNITKSYKTGDFTQVALDKVNLNFRESEFVAILGQSGSGKTTLLNIIGGLDQYDSGELIINGQSTEHFKDADWDAYRNNSVGFIFQSYNLISHLSITDNVEMGMTLSGVTSAEKHRKALEVLEKVGLKEHVHKKPNQLSGGQMQRVAIARALANNPDIILADEPTGALDSETSEQIMELIQTIAEDKLVIMVTHNPELAESYADRVIRFSDGHAVSDSNPLANQKTSSSYKLKETSMSFFTALKLSGKNIATKKWRTGLTAFASSIGIIGIALILSLSNGFDKQISTYETGALSNFPIQITQKPINVELGPPANGKSELPSYPKEKKLYPYDPSENSSQHTNVLTKEYIGYLNQIDPELIDGISYTRTVNMNVLVSDGEKAAALDKSNIGFTAYPSKQGSEAGSYLEQYYDVLEGTFPAKPTDVVLILDEYNRLTDAAVDALGLDYKADSIDLGDLIGKQLKLVMNNDYYRKNGGQFAVNGTAANVMDLYNNPRAVTLNIVGVLRGQEGSSISTLSPGIAYSDELAASFIADAQKSEIVLAQEKADFNVLTGQALSDGVAGSGAGGASARPMGMMGPGAGAAGGAASLTKEEVLASLGATDIPSSVSLYPIDFSAKESVTAYLDKWNEGRDTKDQVEYTDLAAIVTNISGGIMDGITMVLIAFAAISLVVSLIMIGIITYISVMERTKEIGVLRALGARKKDITRVFNAETFIIGACSGILGIGITYLLTFPVNAILYNLTELSNVAQLNPLHALILGVISVGLTMIGGFIPAKMAAKKDPVTALRSE